MSLRATLWAYDHAPVENPTEVLCLIALADEATDDGLNAFPSIRKIAARARVKKRAAQYALRGLEQAGIIRRGDQAIAARHIARADRRPIVYDLDLGMTWESVGKIRPGGPDDVQDLHVVTHDEAHGDAPRTQDGVHANAPRQIENRMQDLHPVANGVHEDVLTGCTSMSNGVHGGAPDPLTLNPTTDDPTKNKSGADAPDDSETAKDLNAGREDVDRLCAHLSVRLTENEVRHTVGVEWRNEARKLLDRDGRTEDQVHRAIDWSQAHHFWRTNIHSMGKLREKYDMLRLQAKADQDKGKGRVIENRLDATEADKERFAGMWGSGA